MTRTVCAHVADIVTYRLIGSVAKDAKTDTILNMEKYTMMHTHQKSRFSGIVKAAGKNN